MSIMLRTATWGVHLSEVKFPFAQRVYLASCKIPNTHTEKQILKFFLAY